MRLWKPENECHHHGGELSGEAMSKPANRYPARIEIPATETDCWVLIYKTSKVVKHEQLRQNIIDPLISGRHPAGLLQQRPINTHDE
jgi:hypothetical protein